MAGSATRSGRKSDLIAESSARAWLEPWATRQHCPDRPRHQHREGDVHHKETDENRHSDEMNEPGVLEAAHQTDEPGELHRLPDRLGRTRPA